MSTGTTPRQHRHHVAPLPPPEVAAEIRAAVLNGESLTPQAAADLTHVTKRAAWLWITRGIQMPYGRTIRLEAVRVGGVWRTSRAALERFIRETGAHE